MRPHFRSVSLAIAMLFVGSAVLEMTPARSQWNLPAPPPLPDIPPIPNIPPIPDIPLVPGSVDFPSPPGGKRTVTEKEYRNLIKTPQGRQTVREGLRNGTLEVERRPEKSFNPETLPLPSGSDNPGGAPFTNINSPPSNPRQADRKEQQLQKCLEWRTSYNKQAIEAETAYTAQQFAEAEANIQSALQLIPSTTLCSAESKEVASSSNSSSKSDIYSKFDFFHGSPQGKFGFDLASRATLHDKLGDAQAQQGKLEPAAENYQQALGFYQKTQNVNGQLGVLLDLGDSYKKQGKVETAIAHYQQALELYQQTANLNGQLTVWLDLGEIYLRQQNYRKTLSAYEQALTLAQRISDRPKEAEALLGQGKAQQGLKQYREAERLCQQARSLAKEVRANYVEVNALLCLGAIYTALKQSNQANAVHRQAVTVSKNLPVGELRHVITTFNGLGNANVQIGKSQDAIAALNYSLSLARRNGDRLGEATALNELGDVYRIAGQPKKALVAYFELLKKQIENNDAEGAEETKEKVKALSKRDSKLATELRQVFSPQLFRRLISIALDRGQLCVAFVLADFSKVVEAENYFGSQPSIRRLVNTASISTKPDDFAEVEALQRTAIQQIQELERLQQIPEANRTPEQKRRIEELKPAVIALFELFAQFVNSAAVTERVAETDRNSQRETVRFGAACPSLEKLTKQQKVALFYPLLLSDDRLALMLYIPGVGPFYKTAPINRTTLTQEITEFQAAILAKEQDFNLPNSKMRQSAQRMYERLLKPFALELEAANVQRIIYASDDVLRYVPLAVLHDGSRWLAERYEIQYIVASSLTDFNTPPKRDRRVLAGAFANGEVTVPVGKQPATYNGLAFAKPEIDNLKARIPNTTQLIDSNFNPQVVLDQKERYTIMHFATHAFFGGTPDDSYIVFGKGYNTLRQMGEWNLKNIDLLTLGACATAFGGQLGDGREILGFGYQTHRAGAKATLASLWAVQDDSTQMFMDRFYATFAQGKSKAAAIRQAQLDLLSGNTFATPHQKTTQTASITSIKKATTPGALERFDHPYYWAPFILIGNGL